MPIDITLDTVGELLQAVPGGWALGHPPRAGAGGQGTVFRCIQAATGRRSAFKVMHPAARVSSERRARFAREAAALRRAGGEGVAELLWSGTINDEWLALMTAWVDGVPLSQWANDRRLSPGDAVQMTVRLVRAVSRCHDANVVHRDIKPDNVIIAGDEQPVLVDFGLAYVADEDASGDELTSLADEVGNRWLRTPESIARAFNRDPRTDLTHCVGILFHLLAGHGPKTLVDGGDRLPHQAHSDSFDLATREHPWWPRLTDIFQVGFQPDLSRRFQTASELLEALDALDARGATPAPGQDLLRQVREVQDRLRLGEFQEVERISSEFIRSLMEAVRNAGCAGIPNAPYAWSDAADDVSAPLGVHLPGASHTRVQLMHRVRFLGRDVEASYGLEGESAISYYRGPSAALNNLRDAMAAQIGTITSHAVSRLLHRFASLPDVATTSDSEPSRTRSEFTVVVRDASGAPVAGASLLAVADNGTHLPATTNSTGAVQIASPLRRGVAIYCAHPQRPGHLERGHDTGHDLSIVLPDGVGLGSVIISEGTGHIPGLSGRLNPIYEAAGRFYLYASNVSVNDQARQPVHLSVNEVFKLEGADGVVVQARLLEIIGRSSLVNYRLL